MLASPVAPDRVPSAPAAVDVRVGAAVTGTVVGLAAGAAAAKLLHEAHPHTSIALAPILCAGLYAVIGRAVRSESTLSVRLAVSVCATAFVMTYCMILAGETYRLTFAPDRLARLAAGLLLVARVVVGASIAPAVAAVAVWRAVPGRWQRPSLGTMAPLIISLGMGAAGFLIAMAAMIAGFALLRPPSSWYALAAAWLVLPPAIIPVWTSVYSLVLSKWEVAHVPESLTTALARLQARCAFRFDRVICLAPSFGSGRIAAVTSSLRSSTLLISESLVEALDPDELLAVLAHETAHVKLHHVRRKIAFGVLATIAWGCVCVMVFSLLRVLAPHNLEIVALMMTGGLFGLARSMYDSLVTRRHEREADEYAARAVGPTPLLTALEKFGAGRRAVTTANRWTTHSTWEIRSARLRQLAAAECRDQRAPEDSGERTADYSE